VGVRIVFTSDLHTDAGRGNARVVVPLAAAAARLRPDVLILAGDIAETATEVGRTLERFAGVAALRLYLPGNHDLFVEGEAALRLGETSRLKFEAILPLVAERSGFEYLGLDPVGYRDWAFVGVPGWFDYSLRDQALDVHAGLDQYRAGQWRGVRAFDRGQVFWPRAGPELPSGAHPAGLPGDWAGDDEICAAMLERLDDQLRRSGRARALVAVVHVLAFPELVQRGAFGPSPFHDAWLGSTRFGERQEPRLRAVLCGHLHRPADLVIGSVRVLARPVGRVRDGQDPAALVTSCLGVLDLE
jgi:3',5'-cyclic AMP phosphodiesterase CpdA